MKVRPWWKWHEKLRGRGKRSVLESRSSTWKEGGEMGGKKSGWKMNTCSHAGGSTLGNCSGSWNPGGRRVQKAYVYAPSVEG